MKRYLWYKVNWNNQFDQIKLSMQNNPYIRGQNTGFILHQVRDDFVAGKFVEKKTISISHTDPFGERSDYQEIQYDYIEFSISLSSVGLQIINPPRSIKCFLNTISLFSDFKVSFSALHIDIEHWITYIRSNVQSISIRKIITEDYEVGKGTIGRLVLSGGDSILTLLSDYGSMPIREATLFISDPRFGHGLCTLTSLSLCKVQSDFNNDILNDLLLDYFIKVTV